MLDLLVDGHVLSDPFVLRRGVGRYVRALLAGLADSPEVRASVLVPPAAVPPPDGIGAVPISAVPDDIATGRTRWERRVRHLGTVLDEVPSDVFHSPAFDPPLECRRPWVQTLHDLISLRQPGALYAWERRFWGIRAERFRHAAAVIAISGVTADDGIRTLGLDPRRVHVVHLGVAPVFGRSTVAVDPEPERPFFLFVSAFAYHKGYRAAFDAIARVAASGLPHSLKVVGEIPVDARSFVDAALAASPDPARVELLGHVPDAELAELYRTATALVVTSRAEGFGLPVVEAMACGAPVVAFDNSSIAEVAGGAALLVPDGDTDRFSAELIELANDSTARHQWADLGLTRAAAFSWERCVRDHLEVYRSVC